MQTKSRTTATSTDFYIVPEPGYYICKPLEEEQVDGIYISDNMSSKDSAGVIIAIGDPVTSYEGGVSHLDEPTAKIGDKIIFSNFSNQRYMDFHSGKHIFFIRFKDHLGTIKE